MSKDSYDTEDIRHVPDDLLDKSPAIMTETEKITAALKALAEFGDVDGTHHQKWLNDQLVRILTGSPLERSPMEDADSTRWTTTDSLGESEAYRAYVAAHNAGVDGPDSYCWDVGIAP